MISVLFATSPIITFNEWIIFRLKVPNFVYGVWETFRATGRVAWVAMYLLILCTTIVAVRCLDKRWAIFLSVLLLVFQTYDIKDRCLEIRAKFNQEVTYESALQTKVFWDNLSEIDHIYLCSDFDSKFQDSIALWAFRNNKTVNYYRTSHGHGIHKESATDALNSPNDNEIFIFALPNKPDCLRYNLNYYNVDDVVVGSSKAIEDFEKQNYYDNYIDWDFNDDIGLWNSELTENGRVLLKEGISHGPFWSIRNGNYRGTIKGQNLKDVSVQIIDADSNNEYEYIIDKWEDDIIEFHFILSNDVEELDFRIVNNSEQNVLLDNLNLKIAR